MDQPWPCTSWLNQHLVRVEPDPDELLSVLGKVGDFSLQRIHTDTKAPARVSFTHQGPAGAPASVPLWGFYPPYRSAGGGGRRCHCGLRPFNRPQGRH